MEKQPKKSPITNNLPGCTSILTFIIDCFSCIVSLNTVKELRACTHSLLMYMKSSSLYPALDQYRQHRQMANTLSLADLGSGGRMPPTLFTSGRILSHHTITGGAKAWCNSYPHSKGWLLRPDDLDTKCPWNSTRAMVLFMILCLLLGIGWVVIWAHRYSSFLMPQ